MSNDEQSILFKKVEDNSKQIAQLNVSNAQYEIILERVSQTIEKLTELTGELSRLASVYEERQNYQMLFNNEIKQHVNRETNDSKEQFKKYDEKLEDVDDRIEKLERWRWLVIGIVIAVTILFPDIQTVLAALTKI